MKKSIALVLSAILLLSLLSGCGQGVSSTQNDSERSAKKLRIVTTIFPAYDWVRELLGDRAAGAEVSMLLDNGVDLHSYQPTVDDMVRISTADVFIYVGGESDRWVDDALSEGANENRIAINLLEVLGERVKEEELVEGMEAEEEDEEDEEEGEIEYDEHVWLSLKNAVILCNAIADALGKADPDHAADYRANAAAYTEKLSTLDEQYQTAVEAAPVKTLLFGDRFPFRYLVEDYGLQYYAAFIGCSAETEASFETIVFLANKVDELGLHAICQIESADGRIAQTIRENTITKDQEILRFDSLQSTTSRDVAEGASYLAVMEQNLAVLKTALR